MSEERFYLSSVTGYEITDRSVGTGTLEVSVLDRAYCHRPVAVFESTSLGAKRTWERAEKRCAFLNARELEAA